MHRGIYKQLHANIDVNFESFPDALKENALTSFILKCYLIFFLSTNDIVIFFIFISS